jgi:hypothetical protein
LSSVLSAYSIPIALQGKVFRCINKRKVPGLTQEIKGEENFFRHNNSISTIIITQFMNFDDVCQNKSTWAEKFSIIEGKHSYTKNLLMEIHESIGNLSLDESFREVVQSQKALFKAQSRFLSISISLLFASQFWSFKRPLIKISLQPPTPLDIQFDCVLSKKK